MPAGTLRGEAPNSDEQAQGSYIPAAGNVKAGARCQEAELPIGAASRSAPAAPILNSSHHMTTCDKFMEDVCSTHDQSVSPAPGGVEREQQREE